MSTVATIPHVATPRADLPIFSWDLVGNNIAPFFIQASLCAPRVSMGSR